MKEPLCLRPARSILLIFCLCMAFRAAEYMLIRTDQSVIGEAFIHKLAGILILGILLRYFSLTWSQAGFTRKGAGRQILYGLLLGGFSFTFAYAAEFFIQLARGGNPSLRLYVTSHDISGNRGLQTAFLFFAVCAAGNVVNVVMEEGVFRGLFVRLMETRSAFIKAALFSSLLFGLWHIAAPARAFLDGEMGLRAAALYACGYALLSAVVGFKFCLTSKRRAVFGRRWPTILSITRSSMSCMSRRRPGRTGCNRCALRRRRRVPS